MVFMSDKAIVNISDVEPSTISVKAHQLREGDYVFDAFGGKHRLRRPARRLKNGQVSIQREDASYTEHYDAEDDFTIFRPTDDHVVVCVCKTSIHDNVQARRGHEEARHSRRYPARYGNPILWTEGR